MTASPGVEVRRGSLDVVADARLESAPGRVPASGWATELENVDARLYLPPGWDLLTVQGVDNLPSTWVGRWSLLDLFLVLIATLGIGRIWGWGWALLALLTLGLTWQAPGAPRLIWLHLLAAAALLRLIPEAPVRTGLRRLRTLATLYFRLALLGLVVIGLPFLVTEVRDGLFPHLERPWMALGDSGSSTRTAAPAPAFELRSTMDMEAMSKRERLSDALAEPAAPMPEPIDLMDPDARLQTGAGIPDWRWNSVDLRWSGPVGEDESARLWLLTPTLNLVLSLLGAVLLVLLGLRLAGLLGGRGTHGAGLALLVALGLGTALGTEPASAEDLPSPELLQELRTRLLAPPDCLPHCVDLSLMVLAADPDRLVLDLTWMPRSRSRHPCRAGQGAGCRPRFAWTASPRTDCAKTRPVGSCSCSPPADMRSGSSARWRAAIRSRSRCRCRRGSSGPPSRAGTSKGWMPAGAPVPRFAWSASPRPAPCRRRRSPRVRCPRCCASSGPCGWGSTGVWIPACGVSRRASFRS
jgi:hypothetical protein